MVSTAYTRGRSREYRVLQTLREEGWLCSRSAASHGPVDIFAGRRGQTLLIQVKSGKARMSELDKKVLRNWAEAYNGRAEVWHYHKRKGLKKTVIHNAGRSKQISNSLQSIKHQRT
jgi:Holliday junction resolvase